MEKKDCIKQCSVVLTRNCNLRCSFCYVKDAGYCKNDMVSIDNLKRIIDFCCSAGVKYIFFTGGEPLLFPNLKEILEYIKAKKTNLSIAIATNGVLLEDYEYCKEIINGGVDYFDVSIKGNNVSEWIETTGYDGYLNQQKAIRNLAELNVEFTCSMVVTLDNVYSVCESVINGIENGAKQFSFTFIIDNDRMEISKELYVDKHNPFDLIEAFVNQVERLNSITNDWWIEYSFPLCMYTEKQRKLLEGKFATPCQIHKNNAVTFDTNMNLLPCDMYFDEKIGKLGDDFTTVEDFLIFKSKGIYKKIIDRIRQLPLEKCNYCQYLEECYGGCPVLWNKYPSDIININ